MGAIKQEGNIVNNSLPDGLVEAGPKPIGGRGTIFFQAGSRRLDFGQAKGGHQGQPINPRRLGVEACQVEAPGRLRCLAQKARVEAQQGLGLGYMSHADVAIDVQREDQVLAPPLRSLSMEELGVLIAFHDSFALASLFPVGSLMNHQCL